MAMLLDPFKEGGLVCRGPIFIALGIEVLVVDLEGLWEH